MVASHLILRSMVYLAEFPLDVHECYKQSFSKVGICFLSGIAFLALFYEVFYCRLSLCIPSIIQLCLMWLWILDALDILPDCGYFRGSSCHQTNTSSHIN